RCAARILRRTSVAPIPIPPHRAEEDAADATWCAAPAIARELGAWHPSDFWLRARSADPILFPPWIDTYSAQPRPVPNYRAAREQCAAALRPAVASTGRKAR